MSPNVLLLSCDPHLGHHVTFSCRVSLGPLDHCPRPLKHQGQVFPQHGGGGGQEAELRKCCWRPQGWGTLI